MHQAIQPRRTGVHSQHPIRSGRSLVCFAIFCSFFRKRSPSVRRVFGPSLPRCWNEARAHRNVSLHNNPQQRWLICGERRRHCYSDSCSRLFPCFAVVTPTPPRVLQDCIIDKLPSHPNIVVAGGFSGMGEQPRFVPPALTSADPPQTRLQDCPCCWENCSKPRHPGVRARLRSLAVRPAPVSGTAKEQAVASACEPAPVGGDVDHPCKHCKRFVSTIPGLKPPA